MRLLRLLLLMRNRLLTGPVSAILILAVKRLVGAGVLAVPVLLRPMTIAMTLALARVMPAMAVALLMPVVLAVRADHTIVVLGMLIKILRGDAVARCARIARHRQILLQNLVGIAANTDIRAAAVECLRALRHMRFTAVVTATLTLHVWTGSHDT